jgi:hypothetical protein
MALVYNVLINLFETTNYILTLKQHLINKCKKMLINLVNI